MVKLGHGFRIGSVGYATEQGLGHLLRWYYEAGVVTDVLLIKHPKYHNHVEWYPETTYISPRPYLRGPRVEEFINSLDAMLFFETPFDWSLISRCRDRKITTAIIPMYEWTQVKPVDWPDKTLSPSLIDCDYFPGSKFISIPASPWIQWSSREVARKYLHNAGHIGHRNHKGTMELLEAVRYMKKPIDLTIRCQHEEQISMMKEKVGVDERVTFIGGNIPYSDLFSGYDVYVAPEKFNGCSMPLQEAYAAGLLVITTNRYPMNRWLPTEPMIPVQSYNKVRVANHYNEIDEAVVDPVEIARVMDDWYEKDISAYSFQGHEWAIQNGWEKLGPLIVDTILN